MSQQLKQVAETAHFMAIRKQKEESQEGAGDKIKLSGAHQFLQVGLTSCFPPPSNDAVMSFHKGIIHY